MIIEKKVSPKLRFPIFKKNWDITRIENIVDRISKPVNVEKDKLYQQIGIKSHGRGIFYKDFVTGDTLGNKRVFWIEKDAFIINIVFAWEQAVAKTTRDEIGMIASHRFPMYRPIENISDLDYILYFFLTQKGKNLLGLASPGGAGRNKTLGQKAFDKLKLHLPSLPEQQKIATFLSSLDQKIQQLTKKKSLLEQYKKGIIQQIFSQQIRFRDDDGGVFGNWEERKLGEVFERVKRKNRENNQNTLTISAQHGLINQRDFFNKSVSARDTSGYYLLHKGEFAYNKSYSKGYPMGAIKKLNFYEKGVVSTLYICFKIKEGNSKDFYEQYFEGGMLNRELSKIAQEGARNHGLLNMSVVEFFRDIKILRPSLPEQQKIATFLSSIDEKINRVGEQLGKMEEFKKGLLQQMFV